MEEKNIIQIIKEAENKAVEEIDKAKTEAEKKIKQAKTETLEEKEKICGNFRKTMANLKNDLGPEIEKLEAENRKNLDKKIIELEQAAEKNWKDAEEFATVELKNIW